MLKISLRTTIILTFCILAFDRPAALANPRKALVSRADTAEITVAGIFQSNMIMQRDKPNKVWGTAAPGLTIAVKASWNKRAFEAKADQDGKWMVVLPATKANTSPQTLAVSADGRPAVLFDNILIGDVWVCSGQSNMVMWMTYANGFLQGVINYQQEIAKASHPDLRYFEVAQSFRGLPTDTIRAGKKWSVCTPQVADRYSALAYYFGANLDSTLHIPIGIVVSAVGATACEAWTSAESLRADSVLFKYYKGRNSATQLYNGMIYPLRNLSVKGFLWDQGESNQYDLPAGNYTLLNEAMIRQWRQLFSQGNLPFYFVQMIPTKFPTGNDFFYALFREAQANVRGLPSARMAVTMDISELGNIHYRNKKIVADRLAELALHYDYGLPVAADGPSYSSFRQAGNKLVIRFNNAKGLKTAGSLAQVFTVAGVDKVFYEAHAEISGEKIILTVPETVKEVKAVRYAFTNTATSRLYNAGGMPAEPFRTDNW